MATPRLSYTGHTYGMNNGGWFGLTQQQNPFSKMNVGNTVGALGAVAGQLGHSLIGGGYDADGVGNGIANIGGTLGGAISTVNPLVGGIVSAASGIVGGLTNRAFGTKENKANINAIEQNTTNMNQVGNALAGVGDSDSFFKMAGSMGSSSGFNTGDLVKGGWFSKGKARRKAQKYLNAENSALAFQNHGMALGAQGVDSNQDDDVMAHFAAYGGEIGPVGRIGQMRNYDNMGAIEYGLAADYIAAKNRKNEIDDKMPGMVGMPALNTFSEGGGIEIKHPGRLTALKKRTGKTEAELWAEGRPEVRKMITFARNARKWKKAYGGYLDAINNLDEAANLFEDGGLVPAISNIEEAPVDNTYIASPRLTAPRTTKDVTRSMSTESPYLNSKDKLGYFLNDIYIQKNKNDKKAQNRRSITKEQAATIKDMVDKRYPEVAISRTLSDMLYENYNNSFAFGGDLQTNGADYPTGLTHIEAGLSHELNPNEGVQMGTDSQGTPNLVEENEVVWQDYVFSNRIPIDEETKTKFHIGKKKEMTYADLAKKLEKEITERPNDPISKAGFNAQMEQLEAEQERQKAEMEAERAREAFEAMSPEEQTALMQQVAQAQQQEAVAQEQAMQEQAMAEQGMVPEENVAPEEAAMIPQSAEAVEQPMQPMAEGGRLYAVGGKKARKIAKTYDKDWFVKQARALGMIGDNDTDIEGFTFSDDDPSTNLELFNTLYKKYQKDKALDTYIKGQRQEKRNELFKNGLYRTSDDGNNVYKARIIGDNDAYIDENGNTIDVPTYAGFFTDEERSPYKKITGNVGDILVGQDGKTLWETEPVDFEKVLDSYNLKDNFKWNEGDAQTLQYPVAMNSSAESKLRYVPILGGAIGLGYDLLNRPDYSRAEAVINAARGITPTMIQPNYIGDYLTYRPMDIWAEQNRSDANARATDRAIRNSGLPTATKNASLLANAYNNQIASSELYKKALEYNDAKEAQVKGFNRGTNQYNSQVGMTAQQANQQAALAAGRYGLQGIITGNQMKDAIDTQRGANISANLGNLLQSIGNLGEEAYDKDRLQYLIDSGVLHGQLHKAKYGGMLTKKSKKGGNC